MAKFEYKRRPTNEVKVGDTAVGGNNPIRIQSMASTSTMDTDGSVAQALRMVAAGAELVRFTAQGVREANNLKNISESLRARNCNVPLVADIHFNPRAAFAAAEVVEKVRINPGDFVDPGRTFRQIEFTESEYASELERLEQALTPFIETCKANNTAVRLGVNHGSLSDRIMSRYGDTPEGMVESAMEFLRVFRKHNFDRVVISIKASNVVVMVRTVLLLVGAMDAENMHYPLHLGVTEAGDGEDARVKSALGIGSLLALGIGDTIRVSLSEEPEHELPVAAAITNYVTTFAGAAPLEAPFDERFALASGLRRSTTEVNGIGGNCQPVVISDNSHAEYSEPNRPDFFTDTRKFFPLSANDVATGFTKPNPQDVLLLTSESANRPMDFLAAGHALLAANVSNPAVFSADYGNLSAELVPLYAAIDFGPALLSGFVDGLMIKSNILSPDDCARLAFALLQSARLRFTHTEFIACPGCGRTLFDLQSTLTRVKEATSHLKGLKIGVMGCIVNGPGEMADADYGYVGAGVDKISLYKGKQCIEKNIPADEAVEHLIKLIKENGDWK
ncbi:MAG: (E)-4-hydroxy-3-methylbut-2-enyl-diphosphate synthase [Firmicutes bacterium]|nr:(E)-4-hydroxy-3-methylbut-2-enyl-diphosphate synthase [Bacillota bacterium]MCM1401621.1 (E)-4-hydroxy-3-methylbut-2-enyl-diphosphate synthase [Bacteroides sp.]MCM1477799.1 (E)-4-hydroxy-3-methylbut-2-enyl-diphosphate synthase [Bacteroides sp.]